MRKQVTRSGTVGRIRDRLPFQCGRDSGTGHPTFFGANYHSGVYGVFSYRQSFPLALWIPGWGWFYHTEKYSRTTTNHQRLTRMALPHDAQEVDLADLTYLERECGRFARTAEEAITVLMKKLIPT